MAAIGSYDPLLRYLPREVVDALASATAQALADPPFAVREEPPTVNDSTNEAGKSYLGTFWYDQVNDRLYVCQDGTAGAAVWRRVKMSLQYISEVIVNAVAMDADLQSSVFDIREAEASSLELRADDGAGAGGDSAGTLQIMMSSNGVIFNNAYTFDDGVDTISKIAGTILNETIELGPTGFGYVRVDYTSASGSTSFLTVTANKKE